MAEPGRPAADGVAWGNALPRFAAALAAAGAMVAFAHFQRDPQHAAELSYLAVLAAVLLAAAAAMPRRPGRSGLAWTGDDPLPWTAVFTVLAAVALPSGPGRGAAVLTVLTAGLGLTAVAWGRRSPRADPGARADDWRTLLVSAAALLPLAVAVQALFRGEMLLMARPDLPTLRVFLLLPMAAAAAAAVIAARHGRATALLAAGTAVLAGNGLHAASTLALLAVAAGEVLARPPGVAVRRRPGRSILVARAAALAVLVAPFAWQVRTAAVAATAGLLAAALAARRTPQAEGLDASFSTRASLPARSLVLLAFAALVVLTVAALVAPTSGLAADGEHLVRVLLLVPFVPLALGRDRQRWLAAAAVLLLAVATARCAPRPEALAIPLAVAALAFAGRRGALHDLVRDAQAAWTGALAFAAALAAAYPWLRGEPAVAILDALSLAPESLTPSSAGRALGFVAVANLVVAALGLRLASRYVGGRDRAALRTAVPRAAALAAGLLAVLAFGAPPPARILLLPVPGVNLSTAEPRWAVAGAPLRDTGGAPALLRGVAVDGNLSHAVDLPAGTPVATVRAYAAGVVTAEWTLHAGDDLAEWAARRPDVGAALAHPAPPAWQTWVAPSGDHFGQIYRVTLRPRGSGTGGTFAARRLVVLRSPDLPPQVVVHLERVEALR